MPESVNILMTGGGAPGAPGILHCLRQHQSLNIICADADNNAVGKNLARDFYTIPHADKNNFIDEVLKLCVEKKISVIMPLVTKELIPLAAAIPRFIDKGIHVLVSPAESLEIANDKGRTYQFLEWRGISVPQYRIVENADQFKDAVNELGYPSVPVCFKPCVSNGSRGFRIIDKNVNETDRLFNHKPEETYITLENAERILSSGSFPELLVSEFLPGDEYSVDCLAYHGEAGLVVPRKRTKKVNGISIKGEFVNNESIISYCKSIIGALKLHGNIGMQVKQRTTGEFLLLEINPRVQGSISTALGAGINLPLLAIKQELGWAIEEKELAVKWGVKFSRYWAEVFY